TITDGFARADLAGLVAYAIALIARLATLPWGIAFYASGHALAGLIPTLLQAVVSAFLAIALLPIHGLPGLAIAVLVASLLHVIVAWFLLGRCRLARSMDARFLGGVVCILLACGCIAAVGSVAWEQFIQTNTPVVGARTPI